jgi:tetratricopeptide (TPR) repeat protein
MLPRKFEPFMKRLCHGFGPILLLILVLGSGGGCTKHARANRMLKKANRDFNAEKYDEAEVEYNNALQLYRLNPAVIGQLGRLYAKEGRILDARMYLVKATELQPNSLPFQLALGQVYVACHDFTNAAKIGLRIFAAQPANEEALLLLVDSFVPPAQLRQLLAGTPHAAENPAYHTALGMLALREKDLATTESEVRLVLAANPKSSIGYLELAELHAFQKDEKEAAQELKTAADLAPPRSALRSKYVDYLIKMGATEDARKRLTEMSEKTPDYIPAWVGLMNLALAEKKYDDAAKFADTILLRDQRNYDALLGQGSASLGKGESGKAVAQFERMGALYKRSPQVKFELAVAYLGTHEKVKAIESLNEALALDINYPQAVLLLAQTDIRNGDPAPAVVMLNRLLKKSPGIVEAHLLLAEAYLAQRKPESALTVYHKLAEALPKDAQVQLLMGIALAGQHKDAEARAAFEKSRELAPDFMPALQMLVELDIAQHKYNDATALVQAQITRSPKAAELWNLQAKIDLAQPNLTQAGTDLLKAIDLNPNLPGLYLSLAQVYILSGKNQEALQKLNDLVARTNDVAAFLQIGAIHEQLKQYDAACETYEKVLAIDHRSALALNQLAYLYSVRLNKLDRAYELAQQSRELSPLNPNIADTLGWILFKKGDYSRALAVLEESAEKEPAEAEIQFHLGMTHYMLGEEDLARVALQRAVASQKEFPNKDDARKRLAVLDMDTAQAGASALPQLEKMLKDQPNDPVILNRIGTLQENAGAWEKAAATYEAALKQNRESVPIMAKLARLYAFRLNQPEKALTLATAAHKLAPDNANVSGVLGHLAYRSGDYPWALSLLENASDRLSNQPELLYDLAWACYSVGRVTDAETIMQKALQSGVGTAESGDAKRFMALTDALTSPAKVQAATGQAAQILQADAKYVPALMVSGAAEEHAGNFKAAQDAYAKALAVFPLFAPAARQLAILDARHFGNDAQGYALAEKARTAYPDDLEVAKSLGILSYYQAKYPRSAELLGESLAKSKDDGELYYYLGMDYYQLKRGKESKQAMERALALRIPDNLATDAKRILAGLK